MSIPYIQATKSSSKQFANPKDEIIYTISIENKGSIPIVNSSFCDTIPACATFVPNSLTINGVLIPGADPITCVGLGTIPINSIVTIQFKVMINEDICTICKIGSNTNVDLPNVSTINYQYTPDSGGALVSGSVQSNSVNVQVNCAFPNLELSKSSDKQYAVIGDIISYKITALNNGNIPLSEVIVTDLLTPNLSFIDKSIKIDGIPYDGSIFLGISLGQLNINTTKVITFDAKIVSAPKNGIITNTSNAEFYYDLNINGNIQNRLGFTESNKNDVYVEKANIVVKKIADKSKVSLNEIITYTVTLTNDSSVDAIRVLFTDEMSSSVSLINGTFTVNGSVVNNVNLETGIVIPIIKANTTTILTYQVRVTSLNCSLKITNKAHVSFKYSLSDGSTGSVDIDDTDDSSIVIDMNLSTFKQINIDTNAMVSAQCNSIESVNNIKGEVEILRYHVIQTQAEVSNEGQELTGFKLVVYGMLKSIIDYTSDTEDQSVHVCCSNKPFSDFIVLPENYVYGSKIQVTGSVEDISYTLVSCKQVAESAKILLVAKILSC